LTKKKILIVEARFYEALTDALVEGAVVEIDAAGHEYERIAVPGVLEIPPAIGFAVDTGNYDAFVALGVVIRGETTHYDTVCAESARGLMDIGIQHRLAIGNGIQTVENEAQAWARCDKNDKNKGGGAALAALSLMTIRDNFKGDK
tara:strand:- start:353 stop:790 length:438 start_codon:yes stop_codon:yes gene_type:complete